MNNDISIEHTKTVMIFEHLANHYNRVIVLNRGGWTKS
jgi:hypothetical protein